MSKQVQAVPLAVLRRMARLALARLKKLKQTGGKK